MSSTYSMGGAKKSDRENYTPKMQMTDDTFKMKSPPEVNQEFAGAFRAKASPIPTVPNVPGAVLDLTTANLRKFNNLTEIPDEQTSFEPPKMSQPKVETIEVKPKEADKKAEEININLENEKFKTIDSNHNNQEKLLTEEKPGSILETEQHLIKENKEENETIGNIEPSKNLIKNALLSTVMKVASQSAPPDQLFFKSKFVKPKIDSEDKKHEPKTSESKNAESKIVEIKSPEIKKIEEKKENKK